MLRNILNSKWRLLALLSLAAVSGCCCQAYPLPGENQCPTDARRLYLSCGEEAVRRCPCGPDHEYYGLKPTCWRTWPAGWGCGQGGCSSACGDSIPEEPVQMDTNAPVQAEVDLSNPFRSNASTDAHSPQPDAETLPLQTTQTASAPEQQPAVQQTPAARQTDSTPLEPAPLNVTPPQTPPVAIPPVTLPPTTPAEKPAARISLPEKPVTQTPAPKTAPRPERPVVTQAVLLKPVDTTTPKPQAELKPQTGPAPAKVQPTVAPKTTAAAENKPAPQPAVPKAETKKTAAPPVVNKQIVDPATPKPRAGDKPKARQKSAEGPLSERVEQHLFNNLQL